MRSPFVIAVLALAACTQAPTTRPTAAEKAAFLSVMDEMTPELFGKGPLSKEAQDAVRCMWLVYTDTLSASELSDVGYSFVFLSKNHTPEQERSDPRVIRATDAAMLDRLTSAVNKNCAPAISSATTRQQQSEITGLTSGQICGGALNSQQSDWAAYFFTEDYVTEAKRRGYTLESCRQALKR